MLHFVRPVNWDEEFICELFFFCIKLQICWRVKLMFVCYLIRFYFQWRICCVMSACFFYCWLSWNLICIQLLIFNLTLKYKINDDLAYLPTFPFCLFAEEFYNFIHKTTHFFPNVEVISILTTDGTETYHIQNKRTNIFTSQRNIIYYMFFSFHFI